MILHSLLTKFLIWEISSGLEQSDANRVSQDRENTGYGIRGLGFCPGPSYCVQIGCIEWLVNSL